MMNSNPVSAVTSASGTMPKTPSPKTKLANTLSMVWPAVMLANSRSARLTGRVK